LTHLLLAVLLAFQPAFEPTSSYTRKWIEGWDVRVSAKLAAHPTETLQALRTLGEKLHEIRKLVPAEHVRQLQRTTFWVEWADPDVPAMTYHPSADWLREHGRNPDMAGGIEIGNIRNFMGWMRTTQPMMVLHELAHSYHDKVLGWDDPAVRGAYQAAVASKAYERVAYVHGGTQRAYALNNEHEYFAELTEAYFGRNDFYPFTRDDLRAFDPKGFAVIEAAWAPSPRAVPDKAPPGPPWRRYGF
jgi:hypothetical protein